MTAVALPRARSALGMLAAIGAAMLALTCAQDSLHISGELGIGSDDRLAAFVALGAISAAFYAAAVALVLWGALPSGAVWVVLAGAVLLRTVPLAAPSFLSSDLYRYVWDGEVQNAGINPYRFIPADPALNSLRDSVIYPSINRAGYAPTIYPPAAQAVFAAVARLSATPYAMKLAMAGFEALGILVMLRLLKRAALPPAQLLIYAWNPVFIWEYAGNGHVDAMVIGLLALALLAASGRRGSFAGLAIAAATLTKLLPLVLFPALWGSRRWRMAALFAGTIAAGYACYASVGWRVLGFLPGYASEEGIGSGSGLYPIRLMAALVDVPSWAGLVWLAAVACMLAACAFRMVWFVTPPTDDADHIRRLGADALLLAGIVTIGLTPHYAWYFGWLSFLACLAPWRSMIWLTLACGLLYLDPIHTGLWQPALLYAPCLVLAIRDYALSARRD